MAVVNLPDNPSDGDTQDVGGITYTYSSSKGYWTAAAASGGGGGGGASVTTDDTAPSSPSDGDLWWDSDGGKMYVYYEDADSSQWVSVSVPGSTGPAGADGADGAAGATGATGPAGTASHVDTWRLSSNVTTDTSPITTWTNTFTEPSFQATLGSAMTHSSGYFTFPTTGYWRVEFFARVNLTTSDNLNIGIAGALYSSGTLQTFTGLAMQTVGDTGYVKAGYVATHMNVTNTDNIKVGFYTSSITSGNSLIASASNQDYSYVMFTRLADAV